MGRYVDFYCQNDMKELKKIVNKIIFRNFGWLSQKDLDDFYSISALVVWECEKKFDSEKVETKEFKSFLVPCLYNKIKSQLTYMHRDKRVMKDKDGQPIYEISLETPIDDDESTVLQDMIESNFNIDNIFDFNNYSEKVEEYINSLPKSCQQIVYLIMDGYNINNIKEKLKMSESEYRKKWEVITSYDKKRILFKDDTENDVKSTIKTNDNQEDENNMENNMEIISSEDMTESYKNTSYSIASISKQLRNSKIKDNHILQRHSGQWKTFAKSELVSDILRGKSLTQIIISEEIKNGLRMQWLIDGKQRCTTLDDYLHNGFAISKNVKNYLIKYQTAKLDENGNQVLNEDGFGLMEYKEFDIRGKKFDQLPEELQDVFRDRQIPVLYNMNCSKKDIADDIARFNRSRPMTKAQNGWLGLDESFAEFAEKIAKMPFFQPDFIGSSFSNSNITSGNIRRIIIEGIMTSDFINDFNKDFEKMCEFLSEEASDSNFTDFYVLIERLSNVCNESVKDIFNNKNSFLWFGLFSRFIELGLEDEKFIEFLNEFSGSLHSILVDGVSFDELDTKSTKDKTVVVKKMEHLEKLMNDYFLLTGNNVEVKNENNVEINNVDVNENRDTQEIDPLAFIKENVSPDITEEDIANYKEDLEVLSLDVDNNTELLDKENEVSLLAMIAYSYITDMVIDEWFKDYFEKNNTYNRNQKENYIHMRDSFCEACGISNVA